MKIESLGILITEQCNLQCVDCCQAIPLINDPKDMTMAEFEQLAKATGGLRIPRIAISGGEPTTSPIFSKICASMKRLFNSPCFELRTNGIMLRGYLDELAFFDKVVVSYYPGRSPDSVKSLPTIDPKISLYVNADFKKMQKPHISNARGDSWRHCWRYGYVNVVANRIYPCCGISGSARYQGLRLDELSIPVAPGWPEKLDKVAMPRLCRSCPWPM